MTLIEAKELSETATYYLGEDNMERPCNDGQTRTIWKIEPMPIDMKERYQFMVGFFSDNKALDEITKDSNATNYDAYVLYRRRDNYDISYCEPVRNVWNIEFLIKPPL